MTEESEHGKLARNLSFDEIRKYPDMWMSIRPYMEHANDTLIEIASQENAELIEAIEQGNQDEIDSELCDVVFALMTLDYRKNVERPSELQNTKTIKEFTRNFKSYFEAQENIANYEEITLNFTDKFYNRLDDLYSYAVFHFENQGKNFEEEMQKVIMKNDINYMPFMFDKKSPFGNPEDAKKCLRIFRKYLSSSQMSNIIYSIHKKWNELPFYDEWQATGILRDTIQNKLREIALLPEDKIDNNDFAVISELFDIGEWSMAPFDTT